MTIQAIDVCLKEIHGHFYHLIPEWLPNTDSCIVVAFLAMSGNWLGTYQAFLPLFPAT